MRWAAAPAPVREGVIARLAFREAAGWLATLECWVHPRDLGLRSPTRLLAEGHVATALALARFLRHLAHQPGLLANADAAPGCVGAAHRRR